MASQVEGARRDSSLLFQLKFALDVIKSSVMVVDNDSFIVYTNQAMLALLKKHRQTIKKIARDFKCQSPLGCSVMDFFQDSAHEGPGILELDETKEFTLTFLGARFNLRASPVEDNVGRQIALVIEWQDVMEAQTTESLVASHSAGASNDEDDIIVEPSQSLEAESQSTLRALEALDKIPCYFILTDDNTEIEYISPILKDYFKAKGPYLKAHGIDLAHLIGSSFEESFQSFFKRPVEKASASLAANQKVISLGENNFSISVIPLLNDEDTIGQCILWRLIDVGETQSKPNANTGVKNQAAVEDSAMLQELDKALTIYAKEHRLMSLSTTTSKSSDSRIKENYNHLITSISETVHLSSQLIHAIKGLDKPSLDTRHNAPASLNDNEDILKLKLTELQGLSQLLLNQDGDKDKTLDVLYKNMMQLNFLTMNLNIEAHKLSEHSESFILVAKEIAEKMSAVISIYKSLMQSLENSEEVIQQLRPRLQDFLGILAYFDAQNFNEAHLSKPMSMTSLANSELSEWLEGTRDVLSQLEANLALFNEEVETENDEKINNLLKNFSLDQLQKAIDKYGQK